MRVWLCLGHASGIAALVLAALKLPGMREPGFDATLDLGTMPGRKC